MNVPYLWGGTNPLEGMDCSGFAQVILAQYGLDPKGDQTAQALHDWLAIYGLGRSIETGALAFYGKTEERISHVAIHLSANQIIEAGGGGPTTTSFHAAMQQSAYIRVRPFGHRKDYLGSYIPKYPDWAGL